MGDYEACFWSESEGKVSGKEGQGERGWLQTYERKGGERINEGGEREAGREEFRASCVKYLTLSASPSEGQSGAGGLQL